MKINKVWFPVAIVLLLSIGVIYFKWRYGFVVAESEDVQVREVPLAFNWITIPGTTDYLYVIEIGNYYPSSSTFRVGWDSYKAEKILIKHLTNSGWDFEVEFDGLYRVRARVGDTESAEWYTH